MSCESACYECRVNGCSDITLKAGLPASTAFYVIITKNNGSHGYQRQLTTDVDGNLVILKTDFPPGYFTGGYFNLRLKTVDYAMQPLIFNAISYYCALVQVVNLDIADDDTSPISTIQ